MPSTTPRSHRQRFARRWLALALLSLSLGATAAEPLRIIAPGDGETIHDNAGNVSVRVTGGGAVAGYRAYVDGTPTGPISLTTGFTLNGIDRGEHQLAVAAVDGNGNPVATSAPITIYMWQASKLFPGRK
jgi:hypothetical protein